MCYFLVPHTLLIHLSIYLLSFIIGRCDEVRYNADQIVILDHSTPATSTSYLSSAAAALGPGGGTNASEPPPKLHWRSKRAELVRLSQSLQQSDRPVPKLFAYGNTTVLCWGRVHPDPAFYNALHVFPIGNVHLHRFRS